MTSNLTPVRLKVTRDLIREYATISDDFNPIHVDPDYAAASPMRGIIAHGTLSLNMIWHAIERTFGKDGAGCVITDVRFRAPVRENDTLDAGGDVLESGRVNVWVRNQNGDNVIEGVAVFGDAQS